MAETKAAAAEETGGDAISNEIERSVGSIWERRGGTRAGSISAEVSRDSIRCTIEGGDKAEAADEEAAVGGTDSNAYRHEASAAVARITHRTVSAYIGKTDKKTGVATQTFILERIRTKF
jgi:hypothetical protein